MQKLSKNTVNSGQKLPKLVVIVKYPHAIEQAINQLYPNRFYFELTVSYCTLILSNSPKAVLVA